MSDLKHVLDQIQRAEKSQLFCVITADTHQPSAIKELQRNYTKKRVPCVKYKAVDVVRIGQTTRDNGLPTEIGRMSLAGVKINRIIKCLPLLLDVVE